MNLSEKQHNFAAKLDLKHFFPHSLYCCYSYMMHSGALLNIWRWEFDNRRQLLDTSFGARSFVYQALATFRSLVFQTLFWQSESGGEHHLIQENLRCPSGSFKVTVIHLVCLTMEEFTRIFCEIRQKLQKLNFHVHSLSISELSSASFIDLLHDHVDIFHWKSGVIRYISSTDHVRVFGNNVWSSTSTTTSASWPR